MSTAKVASAVTMALIAAVGVALYEARSTRESAAAVASLTRERDALRAQLLVQEKRLAPPPPKSESAPKPLSPPPVVAPPPATATRTAAPPPAPAMARSSDPARLARYHQRFEGFVRQQGLSPEQADKLYAIFEDWDDASRDFQASIREQGLTATPEAQKLRDRLQQQIEVEPLTALLGPAGERAYFEYERSSFYRAIVEPFAQRLTYANQPLTDDQSNRLAALVETNIHTVKRDPTAMGSEAVVDWAPVLAAASGFLNPTQLTLMQAQAARQNQGR